MVRNVKISNIVKINEKNLTKKDNWKYINYLDTSSITEGIIENIQKIDLSQEKAPSRAKRKVEKDDIIISTVRPNLKHYGIIKAPYDNMIVSTGFTVLTPIKEKVNPDYLYNFFRLEEVTNFLSAIAETSTTTYPSITSKVIEDLEISLPALEKQNKIASILSSLDEKIELNRKINQNLEEIAQTLFKRWFIDFEFLNEEGNPYKSSGGKMIESELGEIPEGWRVGKLGEILELRKENTSKEEVLENLIYLPIDCLPKKSLAVTEIKSYKEAESSLQLFYENDIVFGAVRAYFHKIIVSPFNGITRKTCFVLKIREIEKFCFGIMTIYQDKTVKYANAHSKGSTMPYAVWENGLEDMPIVIPESNLLTLFNKKVISNFEIIKKNSLQNFKIISIRDYLLPKLMKGELLILEKAK